MEKGPPELKTRPLEPLMRKSMESGLITPSAVNEHRRPDTSVMESVNFHFDTIGSATVRKGQTLVGTGLDASSVLGMHYQVDTVNTPPYTQLVAVTGTTLYYDAAGTWTSKRTGLTSGSKARFSTFLNFLFMVNGTEATAVWDGNPSDSFSTGGNASGAPTGTLIENFRSRMWIGGNSTYPSRVYYSTVPSAVSTPVVSWDTDVSTGQWIDISPSDGDFLTALQRSRGVMLAFKTNRLYRVFDINQVDPDPYYNVGTSSQESVLESKAGTYFHHASGFYQYNIYGNVVEISRPIIDIIRAIPASAYPSVVGWSEPDGDHLCWYVGTVTYGGTTYANTVVRYSISTQVWTQYSYPTAITAAIRRQPFYADSTTQYALVGDAGGNVLKMNVGLDDNGTPISVSLIHKWDLVDDMLSTRKVVQTGNFLNYGGAGLKVNYQTEDQDPSDLGNWKGKVGELSTKNTGFNSMGIKGRKIRFRISGTVNAGGADPNFYRDIKYNGYELLDCYTEFIQFPPP